MIQTTTSSSTSDDLKLFVISSDKQISVGALRRVLPDIETTLFFAKVYELKPDQLGELLRLLWNSSLVDALTDGAHSLDLQDYLVEVAPDWVDVEYVDPDAVLAPPPDPELLTMLWEDAMVEVADSIKEVADKISSTIHLLPSKEGSMLFKSMRTLNAKRPTIGDFKAHIQHQQVPDQAVVLDVSGSMTEATIATLIEDVVALSYNANAHLIIVSNNTYWWEPGTYDVPTVLAKAEYMGTHYETLAPMFDKDWGTVITIADYDSSYSAKNWIKDNCKGHIGTVLDVSLVSRPTFLAECLGQLADEVRSLLVAAPTSRLCW